MAPPGDDLLESMAYAGHAWKEMIRSDRARSVIFAVIASPFAVKADFAAAISLDQFDQEENQQADDNEQKQDHKCSQDDKHHSLACQ